MLNSAVTLCLFVFLFVSRLRLPGDPGSLYDIFVESDRGFVGSLGYFDNRACRQQWRPICNGGRCRVPDSWAESAIVRVLPSTQPLTPLQGADDPFDTYIYIYGVVARSGSLQNRMNMRP